MKYDQMLRSFAVLILLTCFAGQLHAQVIPVSNYQMELVPPVIHGKPNLPSSWELESGKAANVRAWISPGSNSVALGKGALLSQTIAVTADRAKMLQQSPQWRMVLAVDVTGIAEKNGKSSEISVGIRDHESKTTLVSRKFTVSQAAPVSSLARPAAYASSFKAGSGKVEFAFDGNRDTIWHSDYGANNASFPHHLTLDFGESRTLRGVTYVPRSNGGNGTLKTAAVEVTSDGEKWRRVIDGEFKYESRAQEQVITFAKPVKCRAVRLVCLASKNGNDFASCAELIPDVAGGFDGLIADTREELATIERLFVPLNVGADSWPEKVDVGISVKSNRFVVVDAVQLMLVPSIATRKMLGKPNGHLGPDLLGAGSYGFQGMMVHKLPALPILAVQKGSPADRANLNSSDLIVGINGKFLPPGNVAPGFEWFENSHEALLGRAAMEAFVNEGAGRVTLNVLRKSEVVDVDVKLDLPRAIEHSDFLVDEETLSLLSDDLIKTVVATQTKDGHWSNGPIQTSLGGLALLATGDSKHARRINSAANWLMSRNAEPGAGWYWHPAFSGIFLCEYYLATGDERALPVIDRLLRMMGSAFHTSKWGTMTFGHGPKGLPYGNKSLVAVMVHVLIFEELAQRCGFQSEIFETLTPYLESAWSNPAEGGHGGMGYNASYKDQAEFWSRTGLFGLALNMKDTRHEMQVALAEIMRKRHPWFRNSHAYGEPGGVLGLIGLSQMNPDYFKEVFSQYRWWFALAWEREKGLHFTIPHMGAPYMEGPDLINNGYAIVTNIHKRNLQVLGGKRRDWLNVSKFSEPISDVMILQAKDDRVVLRCKIPGPTIYYTTDGSEPSRKSKRFKEPFAVKPGLIVRAFAVNKSGESRITERGFGYKKSNWKIVSSNGHKDPDQAIKRANYAIDGDPVIGWVPDQGEGTTGFPYEFVVDMGQVQPVKLAGIHFAFNGGTASSIKVMGAEEIDGEFVEVGSNTFDKNTKDARIELNGSNVRYLKFVFEQSFNEGSSLLMVGEIDLL